MCYIYIRPTSFAGGGPFFLRGVTGLLPEKKRTLTAVENGLFLREKKGFSVKKAIVSRAVKVELILRTEVGRGRVHTRTHVFSIISYKKT